MITAGAEKLEAAKKQLDELIKYYGDLQRIPIATSLKAVTNSLDKATEHLVPKLPEKVFKKWNTRATSAEKVNAILADFESEVVAAMTDSKAQTIYKQVHALYSKFEFVAEHVGQIAIIVSEAFSYAWDKYGQAITDAYYRGNAEIQLGVAEIANGFMSGLISGNFGNLKAGTGSVGRGAKMALDAISEAIALAITSVSLGLLALIIEGTLSTLTAAYYKSAIVPVLRAKAKAEERLQAAAFPQGTKRYNRVKASKRN